MRIKKYKEFLKESISGTELIGNMGPGYGDTALQNKTLNYNHIHVILSDIDNNFYTIDDYDQIYNEYLKSGGTPLHGFNKENLENVVLFLRKNNY